MHFFVFRALLMSFCMLVVGLLCHGCNYESYWSLAKVSFFFGIMSSAIYYFSIMPRFEPVVKKILFFNVFMNTFAILILWKFIPGFHLASSTTALWMSFLISMMFAAMSFFSFYGKVRSSQQSTKIKPAKARVISAD
ncbi:MAG: hypothetical protein ACOYK6_01120 [Chthoniobacterales bacterium]